MLNKTNISPRHVLADAIADREAVALKHRNAVTAADHAKALMTSAQAHFLSFNGLQDRITTFRAEKIVEWSDRGGDRPSMDLPPALAHELSERDLAVADATSSKAVYERLAADAEATAVAFRRTQDAVSAAVNRVLIEDAEEVADELGAAQALVDALRFRLRAFVETVPQTLPCVLSERARDLSRYPIEPFLVPNMNPQHQELLSIQAHRARLVEDQNSVLDQSS